MKMKWSKRYSRMVERNIGILTEKEQDKLKNSCVAIFGVGGLGGVIAEILTRVGVGSLRIVDKDSFDITNLNRQIFAFSSTIGKRKVDVTERFLKDINPELKVYKFDSCNEKNIKKMLRKANVAVLALDEFKAYVMIERIARKLKIPVVEGWAIIYGNVRVFTEKTPSLEEVYGLPTKGKALDFFSEEEFRKLHAKVIYSLSKIEDISKFYSPRALKKMIIGELSARTFAPTVWLTAVMMANETIKIILGRKRISLAPRYALYDPFFERIPEQKL